MSRQCPSCGAAVYQDEVDVGVGFIPMGEPYCGSCDWFEGGPADYGFIELGDREFCPTPPDWPAVDIIDLLAAALDIDPIKLRAPWPPEEVK